MQPCKRGELGGTVRLKGTAGGLLMAFTGGQSWLNVANAAALRGCRQ